MSDYANITQDISADEAFDACYDLVHEVGYSNIGFVKWNSSFLIATIGALFSDLYFGFSGLGGIVSSLVFLCSFVAALYPTYLNWFKSELLSFQEASFVDHIKQTHTQLNLRNFYDE
ncbi:hypothetical protein V6259_18085 [Marinomonas sp. TI.3.20]|uniref:hypothetical protein n=1 Tax=Marinomonas sp. TI.3.20 TaxID=3121296 RepID=UPI00311EBB4F